VRIGIVSDIHGNAAGLASALALMGDVDELLCAGDMVEEYRFSNETIAILREREARCVLGNHDLGFLSPHGASARAAAHIHPELVEWLARWLRYLGKPIWVVADGAYAKRPFLRRAIAAGVTVEDERRGLGRQRREAAFQELPERDFRQPDAMEHLRLADEQAVITIDTKMADDIMTNAVETGIAYWFHDYAKYAQWVKFGFNDDVPLENWRYLAVDFKFTGEDKPRHCHVTAEDIVRVFPEFCLKFPHLGKNYIGEYDGDAISDDAIFQFAAFGDIVFG
jgi:hypothetical protein